MTRQALRDVLQKYISNCDAALAMWESGSRAFERHDEYSDIDIALLSREGRAEEVWQAVDAAFDSIGGVTMRWAQTGHIFKGMESRVYRPRGVSRWLQVDIGLFSEDAQDLYNQPQRHGYSEVLFDRTGRVKPTPLDAEAHLKSMREALQQEIMKWHLHHGWFKKELARGRKIDAFGFYVGLTVRPLLMVLGMLHRRDRWDYGFRYVKEDMPADVVARLEQLCYVADPSELDDKLHQATAMFDEAVAGLARIGITPIDVKGYDVLVIEA